MHPVAIVVGIFTYTFSYLFMEAFGIPAFLVLFLGLVALAMLAYVLYIM
jgi:hypothetical protein